MRNLNEKSKCTVAAVLAFAITAAACGDIPTTPSSLLLSAGGAAGSADVNITRFNEETNRAGSSGSAGDTNNPVTSSTYAVASGTAAWWAGLTQSQRGDLIYASAKSYLGTVDTNCKEFARKVILQGSRQLVNIPSTQGNDYQWAMPNKYVYPVYGLQNAIHGDVIQMRVYNASTRTWGPHTTIIVAINGDTITVIDSNWLTNSARRGIVAQHQWSISNFLMNTSKVSNWTMYRIGAGA